MNTQIDMDEVLENEGLVYHIINKFSGYSDMEDLYQVGMIGLINAQKSYKNDGRAEFSTYAYNFILGEVTKFIRENKIVKVGRSLIKINKKIEVAKDILRQKLFREPSYYEISIFTGIPEEQIIYVKEIYSYSYPASLDETLDENNEENYYNNFGIYDISTDSVMMTLHTELENLSLEEQKIIYHKYYQGYSQSEISKTLGISQAQVSRKETKVLEKLKCRL